MKERVSDWWRDGVLYQVYPRSFADGNGDGVGDLRGLIARLDYLEWLGVDGLWLNPTFPSPNEDWGFDVSDYRSVHPELGTLEDMDRLVAEAGRRGIRVLLDLVPNHTSAAHPWFVESRSSSANGYRDCYVWRDPKPDGSPPNNWRSLFGGPAWTLDERSGQYYLHNFLPSMPDLNWWNPRVRREFEHIFEFWFDRGIAGFRIDVAHGIVKDRLLRDNPPATVDDAAEWQRIGQRPVYSLNRPEVHDVLKSWRRCCDERADSPVLIGETWVYELERMAEFYGDGRDELHLAMNFVLLTAPFDPAALADIVARTDDLIPRDGWPLWALSNHDLPRFPTRWAAEDGRRVRCLLMLLMTLRGTPILYYGDELGMPDTHVPPDRMRDPAAKRPGHSSRDPARTPMPWSDHPGAGFTATSVEPWLPPGDTARTNVADQRDRADSELHLCRDLIALRRRDADIRRGAYRPLETPPGLWAYRRGERITVALNLSDQQAELPSADGEIVLATDRFREGEHARGALALPAWHGAIVRTG